MKNSSLEKKNFSKDDFDRCSRQSPFDNNWSELPVTSIMFGYSKPSNTIFLIGHYWSHED